MKNSNNWESVEEATIKVKRSFKKPRKQPCKIFSREEIAEINKKLNLKELSEVLKQWGEK